MRSVGLSIWALCVAMFAALPTSALAQSQPSHCIALSQNAPGVTFIQHASFGQPLATGRVRISYVGHSTFMIETPEGVTAATDFTGFLGHGIQPRIATMNHAHESHYTDFPDASIEHVLRGWTDGDGPADYLLRVGDMLVRNVTTDIRDGFGGVEPDGNSIFIFEVAGLCIAHLGHLHHEPTDQQYAAIGRMDIVMAAVDGGLTVSLPTMIRIMKRARARIVLPMHWFGDGSLGLFTAGMADEFDVVHVGGSFIEVSVQSLPATPTVMVLNPRYLQSAD